MPPYISRDYLDETADRIIAEHLRRIIIDWEQRKLDIASDFFDPEVWKLLRKPYPYSKVPVC